MTSVASSTTRSVWTKIKSTPKSYPFAFGFVISGIKTSFSDLLVQKVVEQKEQVDWKRNAAFATFGFLYLGGVQYMIYVPLFGRLFPNAASFAAKSVKAKVQDVRGILACAAQVVLDQCVHHPLLYFPVFYCTREVVMQDKPDFKRCLMEYRHNMKEDMIALWKVWVPSTIINFAFMPMHARIPFVAATSLLWTCILSAMRGGDITHGADLAGGAVTGATLTMLEEGFDALFTSPVELERDMNHIMVTASGKDKLGWVASLSRAVADSGGNITHSKMVRLGNEFIVLLHTSVKPEHRNDLIKKLKNDPSLKGLTISCNPITRRNTGTYEAPVMGVHVRCVGLDKPGMLAAVSEALYQRDLNIENITTDVVRRRRGKGQEFIINADCTITTYMDDHELRALTQDLSNLKEDLGLDVADIRVQRLVAANRERGQ